MKLIITTIFVLTSLLTFGQNKHVEELGKIYKSGDLDKTILMVNEFLKNDSDNFDYKLILGRALADKGDYESSIPNLNYAANNAPNNSWQRAWALNYLGFCHFMLQNYDDSKKSVNECIKLNATKNATKTAQGNSLLFGFNEFYNTWKIVETKHFRFYFQDMSDKNIEIYTSLREAAYKKINEFFRSNPPKKIDFFVWQSREDAKKILRTNLGFAKPNFCIVHSSYKQTIGHEMTHVISSYTTVISKKTKFIIEGTAVCFDQSWQDKFKKVNDWMTRNDKKIVIKDYWENGKEYPAEILYPLAGLFVQELIGKYGKEKFLEFFKNQTYENAQLVYGKELDILIKAFENKINS